MSDIYGIVCKYRQEFSRDDDNVYRGREEKKTNRDVGVLIVAISNTQLYIFTV